MPNPISLEDRSLSVQDLDLAVEIGAVVEEARNPDLVLCRVPSDQAVDELGRLILPVPATGEAQSLPSDNWREDDVTLLGNRRRRFSRDKSSNIEVEDP